MTETLGIPIADQNLAPRPPRHEQELPEERLFELISAFGNHEAKALTLIAMGNGNIFSEAGLHTTVIDHQEGQRRWAINRTIPFQYCEYSLSPIGLVTKEVLNPDLSTYGYQVSEYGRTTGIDLAGLLLKWSYDHPNVSLYRMFGLTNSSSHQSETGEDRNRSPKTRYKIFFELVTNPDNRIRATDIVNALGINELLIEAHIRSLGETGIVTYENAKRGKPYAFYRIKKDHPENEPINYSNKSIMTSDVYSLLKDNQDQMFLSSEDLMQQLLERFPNYKKLDERSIRSVISRICTDLEKQGYVERKKFSLGFQSEITLTDEQKEAIVSLIEVLDRFQMGDMEIRREGREFSQRIMADPSLFSTLMLKAKEASPNANWMPKKQSNLEILSIIADFPGIALPDLKMKYEERTGRRHVSRALISAYANELTQQGLLVSESSKSGNTYRIAPQLEEAS